jgi:hypothetical protein
VNSVISAGFLALLGQLPESVRQQASRAYGLWRSDPHHPSLQFKRVSQRQPIYSARVGLGYRVLGLWEGGTITWFWIGSHAEYDTLLTRLIAPNSRLIEYRAAEMNDGHESPAL